MQLLLLSLGLGALEEVLPAPAHVGFVPTAGEAYADPYFVREDRERLKQLGYALTDVQISAASSEEISQLLLSVEALFVAGGNSFYLMQQLRAKRADEEIRRFVASGRLYIGASAGAGICGPSLSPFSKLDDPTAAPQLSSTEGLGLVDFVVLPHYGKPKYLDLYHSIMKENAEEFRIVPVRDDEALWFSRRDRYERRSSAKILHPLQP